MFDIGWHKMNHDTWVYREIMPKYGYEVESVYNDSKFVHAHIKDVTHNKEYVAVIVDGLCLHVHPHDTRGHYYVSVSDLKRQHVEIHLYNKGKLVDNRLSFDVTSMMTTEQVCFINCNNFKIDRIPPSGSFSIDIHYGARSRFLAEGIDIYYKDKKLRLYKTRDPNKLVTQCSGNYIGDHLSFVQYILHEDNTITFFCSGNPDVEFTVPCGEYNVLPDNSFPEEEQFLINLQYGQVDWDLMCELKYILEQLPLEMVRGIG